MNAKEFHRIVLNHQPVVSFNAKVEREFETGFDEDMMARAVTSTDDGNGCIKISFGFTQFESENKVLEKANWIDREGNATLKWSETNFYPKNKIEEIWFDYDYEIDCFQIIDEKHETNWQDEVNKLNNCPQRQDSTVDQLEDLVLIANKLGFYDAADAIKSLIVKSDKALKR